MQVDPRLLATPVATCPLPSPANETHCDETEGIPKCGKLLERRRKTKCHLAVLQDNSVYRVSDMVSVDLLNRKGMRFFRDTVAILCNDWYRGTYLAAQRADEDVAD